MSMIQWYARLAWGIASAVLLLVPLQSLWLRPALMNGIEDKPFFFLSFWYELAMFGIFLFGFFALPFYQLKLSRLDWAFLVLGGFALLSYFWSPHDFPYHIIGLRYSILPVYMYFLVRLAFPDQSQVVRILKWAFIAVIGVGFIQLLLWFIPGGMALADSLGLSVVHKIGTVPQVYGSLPGPNQLGSYLFVLIFLVWARKLQPVYLLIGLGLLLLILTFSRSAALGLLVALGSGVILAPRLWRWQTLACIFAAILTIWIALSFIFQGKLHDIFTHGASLSEHITAFKHGVDEIYKSSTPFSIIFGHGAGEAGPATFTRPEGRIQESWLLQIGYEYGFIGFFVFGLIFWFTIKEAIKQKDYIMAMVTLGLLANAIFLHIFSDNPALTTLYFALVAFINTEPLLEKKTYEAKK